MGRIVSCFIKVSIIVWFFVGFLLFSAPTINSANVISDIAQFFNPTVSNFLYIYQTYYEKSEYIYLNRVNISL